MPSTADDSRLKEKARFHKELAALEESDDEQDPGLQESVDALKRRTKQARVNKAVIAKEKIATHDLGSKDSSAKGSGSLPRSISDLGPTTGRKAQVHPPASAVQASPGNPSATPVATRHTFSGAIPPASSMPQATGKRKRESAVAPVPIDQQIFAGLHFYFFPNNEKHPARRMRITKAIAFGATWQRDWSDFVTHIILDKTMDYAMLMKFLKKDSLPEGVVLVNESWPPECIAYRALLDYKRTQFRVVGAPAAATVPLIAATPVSSADSRTSLKLKPPGQDVMARQPETQSSGEGDVDHQDKVPNNIPGDTDDQEIGSIKTASTDEFDAAIIQAKDLQMMPLDDEEAESRPSSSGGIEGQRSSKMQAMRDKFQCMQKHTGEMSNSANAATIAILQQMADYYGKMGDEWRIRAYRKAIATLRTHPTKVCTKDEALALPNVGERLATKIEEIAFTNRLRRLDNALAEPEDVILRTFMQVYGAGYVHASNWVRQGYTTLDELLQKSDLTDNQKIGIEHFEDFQERIPRAEVTKHGDTVRKALHNIDPAFEVTIGGSYRRGAKDSGDIDFIITRPDADINHIRTVVVGQLVPKLFAAGFLKAALAATSGDGSKWHGACCLPEHKAWRRIDFLLVPWAEMGAALIYFTGNDIFNRSMRLLASTKGYRLNQRGLYKDVIRGKGRERITEGTLVESRDERKIFDILGVPWRPPEHRIP